MRDLSQVLVGLSEPQQFRADHRRLWFVKFNVFVVIGHTAENVEPACGTLAQQAAENRSTTWRQREPLPSQELDYYRAL